MLNQFLATVQFFKDVAQHLTFKKVFKNNSHLTEAYEGYRDSTTRTKNYRYDFLNYALHYHKEKGLQLSSDDFTLIIKHSDLKHTTAQQTNALINAFQFLKEQELPLEHSHFDTLTKGCSLQLYSSGTGWIPLVYMFVFGGESQYRPSADDIISIFERSELDKVLLETTELNALFYALFYGKLGQTTLEEPHFDYLFSLFSGDMTWKTDEKSRDIILNRKEQYQITKEQRKLSEDFSASLAAQGKLESLKPVDTNKVETVGDNASQTPTLNAQSKEKRKFKI